MNTKGLEVARGWQSGLAVLGEKEMRLKKVRMRKGFAEWLTEKMRGGREIVAGVTKFKALCLSISMVVHLLPSFVPTPATAHWEVDFDFS